MYMYSIHVVGSVTIRKDTVYIIHTRTCNIKMYICDFLCIYQNAVHCTVCIYIRVIGIVCVQVLGVLYELEEFFMDIGPEVEGISSDEVDPAHIMKLVTILNKVSY